MKHHLLLAPAGDFEPRGPAAAVAPGPPAELLEALDPRALQVLRELDPGGKSGLMLRVLRAFDSSMQRLLQEYARARAAGDVTVLRRVAHTLKSSGANVGATHLSQLCADIEDMVREGRMQHLHARLDDMVRECHRLLRLLKHMPPA